MQGTSKMVTFVVDDSEIQAEEGTQLLKACLDNGIYIPNLCYMEKIRPLPASCRMCFVQIEGQEKPSVAFSKPRRRKKKQEQNKVDRGE